MATQNAPEKIASVYLRLNGFLQLPLFTLFYEDRHGQVDIVALRAGNSVEKAMGVDFIVDDEFFTACESKLLPAPKRMTFGLIVEVRGNKNRKAPAVEDVDYASRFFGETPVVSVSFVDSTTPLRVKDTCVIISMTHAIEWIQRRIQWMEEQRWRFTKSGSWELSHDYLSDLLYELRLTPFPNRQ